MESLPPTTGKELTEMLDQKTKERMIAEETERFMNGNFGQLDLSGSPNLNHHPVDRFELQDRQALIEWTTPGSRELTS